jgi:beta-aspartyl-peptidase (threonine type)
MGEAVILCNGEGAVGVQVAVDTLARTGSPLDAVEAGIRIVELDPAVRSVGFGGAPNILGEMEFDASIMCGSTLQTGAVGALKHYVHAISVARQVMKCTPHVMLVGEGAERFAAETGENRSEVLSAEARADYEHWILQNVPREIRAHWPEVPLAPMIYQTVHPRTAHGTTAFLVRTENGNFAGGVSTSGWAYKYPGRLGDSAVIGAGLYVDNRYGAAACTHTGEMTIRCSTSRSIVLYMKKGATVAEACHEAFRDLEALKGGYIGPVVMHAMDVDGNPYVLSAGNADAVPYWLWKEKSNKIELGRSVIS